MGLKGGRLVQINSYLASNLILVGLVLIFPTGNMATTCLIPEENIHIARFDASVLRTPKVFRRLLFVKH